MKPAALTGLLFVFIGSTAFAQLTLRPEIGFDRSKTLVQYNDLSSFSPMGSSIRPKANLRLDYRLPKGHGPYFAIGTSPGVVEFSFANPSAAMNNFKAAAGSMRWRLETGYQYSFKPINFKNKTSGKNATKSVTQKAEEKTNSRSYSGRCGQQSRSVARPRENKNLNMRIQPSLGVAYIPSVKKDITSDGSTYQYNAGNWKTAIVPALGFEFGKGRQRILNVNLFYTKGLGNLDAKTITTIEAGKPNVNSFSSKTSNWGLTVGVPFSLVKNKSSVSKTSTQKQNYKSNCESIRTRCVKKI